MALEAVDGPGEDPPSPPAPRGLHARGAALWETLVADVVFDAHDLTLVHEVCRTLDTIETLHNRVLRQGHVLQGPRGGYQANPALIELRQQRTTYAKLIAALRVPVGDDGDQPISRPQRRAGVRGPYSVGRAR